MPEFKPTKPDYTVGAIQKSTNSKANIGVGWKLPNGQIRIKLNAFVVLNGGEDLVVTVFPSDNKPTPHKPVQNGVTKEDYDDMYKTLGEEEAPY